MNNNVRIVIQKEPHNLSKDLKHISRFVRIQKLAVIRAVCSGNICLLATLSEFYTIDLNCEWYNENLLFMAIKKKKFNMCVYLLYLGVSPNFSTKILKRYDEIKNTLEWYTLDTRQLAYEKGMHTLVQIIDELNKVSWPFLQYVYSTNLKKLEISNIKPYISMPVNEHDFNLLIGDKILFQDILLFNSDYSNEDHPFVQFRNILCKAGLEEDDAIFLVDIFSNKINNSLTDFEKIIKQKKSNASDDSSMSEIEKIKGNEAYKNRDFATAHIHYDKAIELDKGNIVYYLNKSAVLFEEKKYNDCIEKSKEAIKIGRDNRAEYALVAKAMCRIAKCYREMNDFDKSIEWYTNSLSEKSDNKIRRLINDLKSEKKKMESAAYINPELAIEAKNKGNEYFRKGQFADSIEHYTEAIKRNPNDCRLYSNRSAAYSKLMEFKLSLEDAQKCVQLDDTFVKGYLRVAKAQSILKNETEATEAYKKALELDPNCSEAREGVKKIYTNPFQNQNNQSKEEKIQAAMKDPEIMQIMSDPAFQMILQQAQKDPKSLLDHMKDPVISQKIMKLISSGIISTQ
ncbi:Hsp70-Hsp90 organizing protein 1 [Intoshia linei]|uniref:Stress-induced-phosphoprotein 1 n=1 Tax=Intoshia linei TaxID=1819745 RepID=A0A177AX83_9BILA|nr:Hsp70-Hsp90 organizing protein 1 [Intoshia linei]